MNQGMFAFYDDQMQQAGLGSTVSSFSASCTGTASVTGQQTTTTTTGGLWRWGDGVVTNPSNPEGKWAELAEWIEFNLQAGKFFWRRDKKELQDYYVNRRKAYRSQIIPGGPVARCVVEKSRRVLVCIPNQITKRLFTPIIPDHVKSHQRILLEHKLLFNIYRDYDCKKLTHIDHMDGDGYLNLPINLRPVTAQQNKINSAKPGFFPGISWDKRYKIWVSVVLSKRKCFCEELDAVAFRRVLLRKFIANGQLEEHDLWAFDKRVEVTLAYRRENNVDARNRPTQAYSSPVAPINPSDSVTYFLPPVEPIQPRFNTLWYRPAMSVV